MVHKNAFRYDIMFYLGNWITQSSFDKGYSNIFLRYWNIMCQPELSIDRKVLYMNINLNLHFMEFEGCSYLTRASIVNLLLSLSPQ